MQSANSNQQNIFDIQKFVYWYYESKENKWIYDNGNHPNEKFPAQLESDITMFIFCHF